MSLNLFLYNCSGTVKQVVSNKIHKFFKLQSTFKPLMSQNLLTHFMAGLSQALCKEQTVCLSKNNESVNIPASSGNGLSANNCENLTSNVHERRPINLICAYFNERKRNISEHSDDICFLEDNASNNVNHKLSSFEDDSEDDSYCFDADYENVNGVLDQLTSRNHESHTHKDSTETPKKVRFTLPPEIHTMYTWSYAYRSARKGHWETIARDRDRFRKRIANISKYINPILSAQHRSSVYNTRFSKTV